MSSVTLRRRRQPPGDQPLVRRRRRGRAHVHGGAGHHDRQRRAALHRRRPVGGGHRQRVGPHQLPGRQRHHPADLGLDLGPPRPPQLLPAVDRRLHHRLGAVRHGHQPGPTDPVPGDPGPGRRRAPAVQPGRAAGQLPAREAGRGHDDVRHRGPARAGRRPDAGRLSHGQLRLALDLLHQSPGRRPRLPGELLPGRRPGLPQARAGGAAPPPAELRLHRLGAARSDHVLLGSHAQQGAGMGLAGRSLLAGADAVHPVRARAGRPVLP